MLRIWTIIFILVNISLPAATSAEELRRITVEGSGAVQAAPDVARVSLGVVARGTDAASAMAEVSEKTAAIMSSVARFGVSEADVQTSNLSLSPRYDAKSSIRVLDAAAFEANLQITVTVRDIAATGPIISAVLEDGANSLGSLWFDVADKAPLMNEARQLAVADAMSRAALYAQAAGVTLGPVVSISDIRGGSGGPVYAVAEMRVSDVPIAAGSTSLQASVTMTFAIAE